MKRVGVAFTVSAIAAGATIAGLYLTRADGDAEMKSGDTSARCYSVGSIDVKVKTGQDINAVARSHGAKPQDISHGIDPPFDAGDREVGLDRWFSVKTPPGTERRAVSSYAQDIRVEFVQLVPDRGLSVGPVPAPDVCENLNYERKN